MTRQKILLVDDDPEVLETYKALLEQLPCKPVIHTAASGSRALAKLNRGAYKMLVCDLHMPRMDGLQVLSLVRRKHPMLRTVVLTGVPDEQFRSRVYSLGVDLYWHKPASDQEINQFLECCESLLGSDDNGAGFRGVQSKSLMDIIQLECMSQSSSVLRINNGQVLGRIWIQDGEVVDAETDDLQGEQAFLKIFSWQTGSFETQQAEPHRTRTIFKPYNTLLLESAQALDESRSQQGEAQPLDTRLAEASQIEGLEFVVAVSPVESGQTFATGVEDPNAAARWTKNCLESFGKLGERLHAGQLVKVDGLGVQRRLTAVAQNGSHFCIGWKSCLENDAARDVVRKVLGLWTS
jgi:CheY-like chemotaxis protein